MQTKGQPSAQNRLQNNSRRLTLGRLGGLAGLGVASGGLWLSKSAMASARPDWAPAGAWQTLLNQMVATKGLSVSGALAALESLQRQDRAIALVNPPPDAPIIPRSLNRVLARNLDAKTLADGRAFMTSHRSSLDQAQAKFGVPASVICGILGVETRFGRIQGSYFSDDVRSRNIVLLLRFLCLLPALRNQSLILLGVLGLLLDVFVLHLCFI